jgi:hypothetical protein
MIRKFEKSDLEPCTERMQYRKLGKTSLEVSEIGMGLEHLLDKEESIIMVFHIILKNVESNNRRNRWYL